jgi:RNA polymerase sigma-70 factor (ECF subfamily)
MDLSDSDVERACTGDPAAVEGIYRQLAPRVQRYLWGRGSDDPEGLTNDVFLALIPRLGSLEGGADGLVRLTFSIAHARYVDEVRRRVRRPAHVPFEHDHDRRTSPGPETEVLGSLAASGSLKLLDGLGEAQRDVIVLRVLGDLSLEQTAGAIGRSVGAVKQLQRRGLLALRAMLEEGGGRDG